MIGKRATFSWEIGEGSWGREQLTGRMSEIVWKQWKKKGEKDKEKYLGMGQEVRRLLTLGGGVPFGP